jgi:hypothetical protein
VRNVVVLVVAGIAIAGCGGGGSGSSTDTTVSEPEGGTSATTGAAEPQPTTSAVDTSNDQAVAESAVLVLSDFEPGWRGQPADDEESPLDCARLDEGRTARAESQDFERDQEQVSSTAVVYETEEAAAAAFAVFSDPETEACFRDGFDKLVREGAKDDPTLADAEITTTLGRVSADPVGDENVVYQAEVTVGPFAFLAEIEAARIGRSIATVNTFGFGSALAGRTEYTSLVADRLSAGLAGEPVDGGSASGTTTPPTTVGEKGSASDLTVESGFSSKVDSIGTRYTSAGATVTNGATQSACSVSVQFNLKDAAGATIDTATETIDLIPAGSTAIVAPLQIGFDKGEPSAMEVGVVKVDKFINGADFDDCEAFSMAKGVPVQVLSPAIVRDQFFAKVQGQLQNTSSELVETSFIDCIFRAGGAIVGGESTASLDPIPAGGTVAFSLSASFVPDNADSVECQAVA